MRCKRCGTENPDDAMYCRACGSLLSLKQETEEETVCEEGKSKPMSWSTARRVILVIWLIGILIVILASL